MAPTLSTIPPITLPKSVNLLETWPTFPCKERICAFKYTYTNGEKVKLVPYELVLGAEKITPKF